MLRNWIKIAFTNYKRNWTSTMINLLGLTIGFTVFILVFLNWQDEKSYESWVPNKENIYLLEQSPEKDEPFWSVVNYPILYTAKEKFPEIEDYTIANVWNSFKQKLNNGTHSAYSSFGYTIETFFDFFPFEKVAGSYHNIFKDETTIALSETVAQQLFGNQYKKSIGKIIQTDHNGKNYVVTAIYKLPKVNSVIKPGFLLRQPYLQQNIGKWQNSSYISFFRLKQGADLEILKEKLRKLQYDHTIIENGVHNKSDKALENKISLTGIDYMRLDAKGDGIEKGDKKSILILLSLSGLILLLSGVNFINLKTAQATERAKEVGIRKAIGSSKIALILQFLLETFMLFLLAFIFSLVLLELLLPSYNKFLGKSIQINDWIVYWYYGLVLMLFCFTAGIVPAVYLSGFKPIETLKGNFSRSKYGIWLRNSILVLQLIISSFFIICSFIIYIQVKYMMDKDLGFKGDQIYQIDFQKSNNMNKDYNYRKYNLVKNEIKNFPFVIDVTGSLSTIGKGFENTSGTSDVRDEKKYIDTGVGAVDVNYFRFYQIKFVAGRDINPMYASDTANAVIANESFVKKMGWTPEQSLNKVIKPGFIDKKQIIIGVVRDFYMDGVEKEILPSLFYNYDRGYTKNHIRNIQIKLSGDNIAEKVERIRKYWETKVEPGYPFSGEFVNKNFAKTFDKYKKQRLFFSILNSIVLVVALLGLFALSSLMIDQKLKDVAIKKTLGASDSNLIRDLTKKYLWLAALAVLLSIPFSYYFMNEWLKEFAYRIEMPWWPYVLSFIILLLLTFLVVSIKAYRATKVELVKYLKYE
ncbi:antibiotic ABC transporter permease [Elizabethkingia anophelis]|nr:ABC transporter permease [Elizabethkingia anophelis]MCT3812132.1 ABC transporter permease [Elizabethkingia anophelis]MCT3819229.1 ABC transporter permease [Elizabethkingia anophelis]MCT3941611.1 ABC transporter permease [Elizabethkingia anophelis]MCT4194369.1 ABC transporter permease [Elizabethkingia anophelis]